MLQNKSGNIMDVFQCQLRFFFLFLSLDICETVESDRDDGQTNLNNGLSANL